MLIKFTAGTVGALRTKYHDGSEWVIQGGLTKPHLDDGDIAEVSNEKGRALLDEFPNNFSKVKSAKKVSETINHAPDKILKDEKTKKK